MDSTAFNGPSISASAGDVHACYKLILGREPESDEAILSHLALGLDVWSLIQLFYASVEAQKRRVSQASAYVSSIQKGNTIEAFAETAITTAFVEHIEKVWSDYGRDNAYFSVLTNPRYLQEKLHLGDIEHFYGTGALELSSLKTSLCRNSITFDPRWNVMELGCGVGRIAEHFSACCESYLGVDISVEHLQLAQSRKAEKGLNNVNFKALAEFLTDDSDCDLFFSMMVLQHNPPPVIVWVLNRILCRIKAGGYAYFQVPCHLYGYSFSVKDYMKGVGKSEHMEMHAVPQSTIFRVLHANGMIPVEVFLNDRAGDMGISYTFLARKT